MEHRRNSNNEKRESAEEGEEEGWRVLKKIKNLVREEWENDAEIKRPVEEIKRTPQEGHHQISSWKRQMKGMIEGDALLLSFGSLRSAPSQFTRPQFISISQQLNIIVVTDYYNNRVQIFDIEGTYRGSLPIPIPRGIAIIPSLHLLAIVSYQAAWQYSVSIYDLHDLHDLNDAVASDPHHRMYDIPYWILGENQSDPLHFQYPDCMAYSEEMQLLAVCDIADKINKRVQMVEVKKASDGRGDEGAVRVRFHSSLLTPLRPISIAFSHRSLFLTHEDMVVMYSYSPSPSPSSQREEGGASEWVAIRHFQNPNWRTIIGVGLWGGGRYVFAYSRQDEGHMIVVWKRSSGAVVYPIAPNTVADNHHLLSSSILGFPIEYPEAVCVDDELIAISDTSTHCIRLFRPPF